eukprot:Polyplicarium_translucidae@DN3403_c1_g1_i5.p3
MRRWDSARYPLTKPPWAPSKSCRILTFESRRESGLEWSADNGFPSLGIGTKLASRDGGGVVGPAHQVVQRRRVLGGHLVRAVRDPVRTGRLVPAQPAENCLDAEVDIANMGACAA